MMPMDADARSAAPHLQSRTSGGSTTGYAAVYQEDLLPAYRDNPLIATLPPVRSRAETHRLLEAIPPYDPADRRRTCEERLTLVLHAQRFFQPLDRHFDLDEAVAGLIREGYVGRSPVQPGFLPAAQQRLATVLDYRPNAEDEYLSAQGFTLIGLSGIGKTRSMQRILGAYPQVIEHRAYRGQPFVYRQLVWLKLDCPPDGSRAGLCRAFFHQIDRLLGTQYYRWYAGSGHVTVDTMLVSMSNVCLLHGLGVLVIDELQNLNEARRDDAPRMLNFLTTLDNTIGVPVILIGTPRARSALAGGFRRARRAEGVGGHTWERLEQGDEWALFVDALWQHQYVAHLSPLTAELRDVLYDESQGIPDIAIKLYVLAQRRAIVRGSERITATVLRATAREQLPFVRPFLTALRTNDTERLLNDPHFDDITTLNLATVASEPLNKPSRLSSDPAQPVPVVAASAEHEAASTNVGGAPPAVPTAAAAAPAADDTARPEAAATPAMNAAGATAAARARRQGTRGRRAPTEDRAATPGSEANTGECRSAVASAADTAPGAVHDVGAEQPVPRRRRVVDSCAAGLADSGPADSTLLDDVAEGARHGNAPHAALRRAGVLEASTEDTP